MKLICLHVTPGPSQETFLEKENVQCHFITHTSWARYLRGRLEDLVFLSEIRFTNLGWERNVVEYKNLFYSKFLVKLLISCTSTIFLLTGLFLWLVSAKSRDISTHPNFDWGLCYALKQYREIRYCSGLGKFGLEYSWHMIEHNML